MNNERLTSEDYKRAIDAQDACNLSGIVHSFSDVINKIWATARALECGTDWVNQHPISVLYSDKIASLSGSNAGLSAFSTAYDVCKREAAKCA